MESTWGCGEGGRWGRDKVSWDFRSMKNKAQIMRSRHGYYWCPWSELSLPTTTSMSFYGTVTPQSCGAHITFPFGRFPYGQLKSHVHMAFLMAQWAKYKLKVIIKHCSEIPAAVPDEPARSSASRKTSADFLRWQHRAVTAAACSSTRCQLHGTISIPHQPRLMSLSVHNAGKPGHSLGSSSSDNSSFLPPPGSWGQHN